MKLRAEELTENNYVLLDQLNHAELVHFVKKFLHKKTFFSFFYYLSTLASFILLLYFITKYHDNENLTIQESSLYGILGIAITIASIPIHEIIHALAYRSLGAKQTSFDADFKRFVFLAVADQFVANKRELRIVALSPFILISLVLIVSLFFSSHQVTIAILTALTMHTTLCSGDFALLSYFNFHKDKEVVTYDDKENKVSYFYGRDKI